MKNLIILLILFMSLGLKGQDSTAAKQDSLLIAYRDASDLYKLARDGYYLKKIDSINNFYILNLENKLDTVKEANRKLEVIVEKDTKLIESVFGALKERQATVARQDTEIIILKADLKRQKKLTREAILGGTLYAILSGIVMTIISGSK